MPDHTDRRRCHQGARRLRPGAFAAALTALVATSTLTAPPASSDSIDPGPSLADVTLTCTGDFARTSIRTGPTDATGDTVITLEYYGRTAFVVARDLPVASSATGATLTDAVSSEAFRDAADVFVTWRNTAGDVLARERRTCIPPLRVISVALRVKKSIKPGSRQVVVTAGASEVLTYAPVLLQRRKDGRWVTAQRGLLDLGGAVVFRIQRPKGAAVYRVRIPRTERTLTANSRTFRLRG